MNKYTHQKLCCCQQPICTVICSHRFRWGVIATHCVIANISPRSCSHRFSSICVNQWLTERILSVMINPCATRKHDMHTCCHTWFSLMELQTGMWLSKCIYYLVSLLAASHHMWPVRSGKATCSTERIISCRLGKHQSFGWSTLEFPSEPLSQR